MMSKIDPEKLPAEAWVPVTEEMLKDMYTRHLQRKANRKKSKTFMNGYGMIVSTRKTKAPLA
jgi:hypothetical protein